MKKTYWWRIVALASCFVFGAVDYLTYCESNIRRCFWNSDMYILQTMFHFLIPISLISLITFFLSDNLFKKWFIFGVIWFFISLFFISITPEYSGGWISLTPDREQVSIWMSSLFLIISLILIIIWSVKERKSAK